MKGLRWIIALGVVLLLAGGGMFAAGMNMTDWKFDNLDPEILTAASFTSEHEIDSVKLSGSWDYEIRYGETFGIEYYESSYATITVGEQKNGAAGKYMFEFKESFKISFGITGIKRKDLKVIVTVAEACDLTVSGSDIDLHAEKGMIFKDIRVTGSSADVELENITAQDIYLKGSDLDAALSEVAAQDITVNGSSSRLELSGVTARSITADGSDCSISLQNTHIAEKVSLKASSGKLILKKSSIKDVYIKGSSVRVAGENADIRTFEGSGSSVRAELNLVGTTADLKTVSASGSSARSYVDGTKGDFHLGNGYKTLSVSGSDACITVKMLGGESIFSE